MKTLCFFDEILFYITHQNLAIYRHSSCYKGIMMCMLIGELMNLWFSEDCKQLLTCDKRERPLQFAIILVYLAFQ